MSTRSWSTAALRSKHVLEKVAIVLSALCGKFSINEASRKQGISYKTLLAWRNQFLKGGEAALQGKGPDAQVKALENENRELKEALAEMALGVEVLRNFAASASELWKVGVRPPRAQSWVNSFLRLLGMARRTCYR